MNAQALLSAAVQSLAAGAAADAERLAARAREADPHDAQAAYAHGRTLKALGRLDDAIAAYRAALALAPDHVDTLLSLGVALRAHGQPAQAAEAYEHALRLDPAHPGGWQNLANVLQDLGRPAEAAIARARVSATAIWAEASALHRGGQTAAAIAAYRRVVALAPDTTLAWHLLGGLHEHQGEIDEAARCYAAAERFAPHPASRICSALLLPTIVPHGTDLVALRQAHEARLRALIAQPPVLEDPLLQVSSGPVNEYFRLAYHGLPNRELHTLYAQLFLRACPSLAWVAPHCRAPRAPREPGARPLRIGFISRFFRQHSIGKTSVGLIERLPRPGFEVHALFLPPRHDDTMARRIAAGADHAHTLPEGLAASREAIAALGLDILFYQDIGMEPHSYFLAFARLAPLQCVSFGHPDTTGLPNMDAWISSRAFEPDDAQAHYSERLVCLDGVGTLACYDRPQLAAADELPRAAFGLPDGVPLLACPQSLFKFHPEMDELLAAILARLPGARLLLVSGDVPAWRPQLMARWAARGDGIDRAAFFLPPLAHASYLSLIRAADVMLDPLHFNGMNSSLEALAMGTPVVTLPGALQRGRHTQAMYRRMGWTPLVAQDAAHYVDLVVRLAREPAFRAEARREILARCPVLFHEQAVVDGFAAAFRTLMDTLPR